MLFTLSLVMAFYNRNTILSLLRFVILLLICVKINYCYLEETKLDHDKIKFNNNCIKKIVEKYFLNKSTISIFTTNFDIEHYILKDVYEMGSYDKKLWKFNNYNTDFFDVNSKNAIIVVPNLDYLLSQEKQIKKLFHWNARAKYIIYSLDNINNTESEESPVLNKVVRLLWRYYIINVVLLIPTFKYNGNQIIIEKYGINIYTYFPYANNSCGEIVVSQRINYFELGNGKFENNEVDLFPKKVPEYWSGCLVKIRAMIWAPCVLFPSKSFIDPNVSIALTEGIEVQLAFVVAKFLGLKLEFYATTKPFDWGAVTADGNASGSIKLVIDRTVDMAIGGFGAVKERQMYADYSVDLYTETVSWCLPKAQEASRWKNLLSVFTLTAWVSMVIMYIFTSFLINNMSTCPPKDSSSFIKLKYGSLHIFSLFLGISASDTPLKISSRICFISWLIFSLHFIVAYQAKLMTVLLQPTFEKQISTVEEMVVSKFEFSIVPTHTRFFLTTKDERYDKIIPKLTICLDAAACLDRVALKRDLAFLIMRTYATINGLKYHTQSGDSMLYFITYLVCSAEWYMTKGYPLRDRINQVIKRCKYSGLLMKWQNDIETNYLIKYLPQNQGDTSKEQVLTIEHMQGAFALIIFGWIIAIIVFSVEKVYYAIKNIKTKTSNLNHS